MTADRDEKSARAGKEMYRYGGRFCMGIPGV